MLNMGVADRRLRALVAAPVLVAVGVIVGPASITAIVLYGLAVVMLATSAMGFCPIYRLLRIQTQSAAEPTRQ